MKKVKFTLIALTVITALGFSSCKKCSECHYDKDGAEVEIGEYCDDDLEAIEANGYHYHEEDTTYEAHCHGH